ncbi:hypothetical protein [Rubinisphaera margarita]|uniref:hypothetical protein n=1 Tax=Rubinisphaera margarita TaxID=2909586 RepID=UPI001EE846EA|nr:hypothetical protein [Rubinisphaera margarita]MCG6154809.1 hypothetical protein [Rubinisphaera margarita]
MGLDYVEVIMEIEDLFQIEIDDEACAPIRTVGDLYEVVLEKLDQQREAAQATGGCPTIPPFLNIRNAIVSLAPVERKNVRPSSRLEDLLPENQRILLWRELQQRLQLPLPPLVLPDSLRTGLLTVSLVVFLTATVLLIAAGGSNGFALAVSLMVIVTCLLYLGTRPLTTTFPSGCTTVADIVRRVRPPYHPSNRLTPIPTDRNQIWQLVVQTVAETLNEPASNIEPQTRFYEDLHCG